MLPELELLYALKRYGIPFVTIGAHAVAVHGHIRATEDVDAIWLRTAESEAALLAMLSEVNARYLVAAINPETGLEAERPVTTDFLRNRRGRVMALWTAHGFLDLFDYVPGFPDAPVEDLLRSRIEVHDLPFVSLKWLRRMKSATGRPEDAEDLRRMADA